MLNDALIVFPDIFDWPQRIRVAIGLACLLDFLHGEDGPYMVRNIDAAHILVDKVGFCVTPTNFAIYPHDNLTILFAEGFFLAICRIATRHYVTSAC